MASSAIRPALTWLNLQGSEGAGDEARAVAAQLRRDGADISRFELKAGEMETNSVGFYRDALLRRMPKPGPGAVTVHHYAPFSLQVHRPGSLNVARAMFETDRIPAVWVAPLLARAEVWVPSQANVESFYASGIPVSRLRAVPAGVDLGVFRPDAEPADLGAPEGAVTFLADCPSAQRSGWQELVTGWARAFGPGDGACLVIRSDAEGLEQDIDALLKGRRLAGAPIRVIAEEPGPAERAAQLAGADAYVSASHGEGLDFRLMEAIAAGVPAFAPAWGASHELAAVSALQLLDGAPVKVPALAGHDGLLEGHRWFQADPDALAQELSRAASGIGELRQAAAEALPRFAAVHSLPASAAAFAAAAQDLLDRTGGDRPPGLVFRGDFGSVSSLALVNDGLLEAFTARGLACELLSRGSRMDLKAPSVSHTWPAEFAPGADGPSVTVLPWEYGAPPADWAPKASRLSDRIWTYSQFVKDSLVSAGMPEGIVDVIGCGHDAANLIPDGPALDGMPKAGCVFLFVGGSIWRKGVDILAAAWEQAFKPGDDVALIFKDHGSDSHYRMMNIGEHMSQFAARTDIAPVHYFERHLSAEEMGGLYRSADVLVHPYRGEGFGLPILEAMACGRPVVIPDAGPAAEYVPDEAGWKVHAPRQAITDIEKRTDTKLEGEAFIHEMTASDLAAALRAVADAGPAGRAAAGRAARAAAAPMTWQAAGERALASLQSAADDGLPLARDIPHARIGGRAAIVALAPDPEDRPGAVQAVSAWAEAAGPDTPATLAVWGGQDPEEAAAIAADGIQAAGQSLEGCCDVTVVTGEEFGSHPLLALSSSADAVLLTAAQDASRPAQLCRRARRLLTAAQAGEFAAGLEPDA